MKIYSLRVSKFTNRYAARVFGDRLEQPQYNFNELVKFDVETAIHQLFRNPETKESVEIDRFIFWEDAIWAIAKEGDYNFIIECNHTFYVEACSGTYALPLDKLNTNEVVEIDTLDKEWHQAYVVLLMLLRVCMLQQNQYYVEGIEAIKSLKMIYGKNLIYHYLVEIKLEKNTSLVDLFENLNEHNPIKFYLDALLNEPPYDLNLSQKRFSISGHSQLIYGSLEKYIAEKHKRSPFYKRDYRMRETYRVSRYDIDWNPNIETSSCSCFINKLVGSDDYDVSTSLYEIQGLLHITYRIEFNKELKESVSNSLKNSNDIKNQFALHFVQGNSILLEKVRYGKDLTVLDVYKEVTQTLDCMLKFLNEYEEKEKEFDIYQQSYQWSSKDLADYYGYYGYSENHSIDDFLDNL